MSPNDEPGVRPFRTAPTFCPVRSDAVADTHADGRSRRDEPPQSGGCGCWTANLASGALVWNDTLCQLAGRSAGRGYFSVGESLRYFAPEAQPRVLQALQAAWRDGTGFAMEAELISESGRRSWVEIVCGGRMGPGHDASLRGTVQDISARRAAAAAHERYRIALEKLAEEGALELQAARVAGEAAHRAKSRFLSNMSHEFRTPLNAIVGFAYLLRARAADPKADEQLAKIGESAEHLLEMIDDVLDFARLEAEMLALETTDFLLDSVLEATCRPLVGRAAAKGLEIVFDIDPALTGTLSGDPLRLGQVLRKLMENALKFTERGAVLLSASKSSESESDIAVQFQVRDTGIGVPEEQRVSVFGPFEQADDSSARHYGGMGMGLAISRELARLMGGELSVESNPGGGSAFGFTARFRKGAGGEFIARRTASELAGRRALVADDQRWLRQAMARLLREFGLRVDEAETGAAMAARIQEADQRSDPFDMVLIDFDLLNVDDGRGPFPGVASLILKRPPSVWILMGFGPTMNLSDAREAGFHSLLQKPVTLARLDRCISECLEAGLTQGTGAAAAGPR